MKIYTLVIIIAIILAVVIYHDLNYSNIEVINLEVTNIENVTLDGFDMKLNMTVKNTALSVLFVDYIDYDIEIAQIETSQGKINTTTLLPYETSTVELVTHVTIPQVIQTITTMIENGNTEMKVSGNIYSIGYDQYRIIVPYTYKLDIKEYLKEIVLDKLSTFVDGFINK